MPGFGTPAHVVIALVSAPLWLQLVPPWAARSWRAHECRGPRRAVSCRSTGASPRGPEPEVAASRTGDERIPVRGSAYRVGPWGHDDRLTHDDLDDGSSTTRSDSYDDGDPTTGALDLADRAALRRVAGLSTELADVTEVEYRQLRLERVVLVGVWTEGTLPRRRAQPRASSPRLAETAGSEVLDGLIQRRDKPDPATYIGSGKAQELRDSRRSSTGADTVICDGELTPGQLRQLEDVVKVKVIDRTALILDIFAQHAQQPGGQGAGRAGPDAVPAAAAARLGRVDVAAGRWRGRLRRRRRHARPR